MTLSPQDWKGIEERLKFLESPVKLNCDGYEITLVLQRISQFSNAIMVYVNGKFNGKWLMDDCEERRRFCQARKRSLLDSKQKAAIKRWPKKDRLAMVARAKYISYSPHWTSFRSLKNHLIKNNKSIELINE